MNLSCVYFRRGLEPANFLFELPRRILFGSALLFSIKKCDLRLPGQPTKGIQRVGTFGNHYELLTTVVSQPFWTVGKPHVCERASCRSNSSRVILESDNKQFWGTPFMGANIVVLLQNLGGLSFPATQMILLGWFAALANDFNYHTSLRPSSRMFRNYH